VINFIKDIPLHSWR